MDDKSASTSWYWTLTYPLLLLIRYLFNIIPVLWFCAFLTLPSPLYQLCSIPPVTWTRSISAANAANLLNRNAWRPNCFSFEALRPISAKSNGPSSSPRHPLRPHFTPSYSPPARFHLARPAKRASTMPPSFSTCFSFLFALYGVPLSFLAS